MAKLYGEIASKALLTLDKSFARANGQPLDASEVYYSLAAAEEYAAGAQAYIGQKIVVIENGVVTHYSVNDANGTLKELGAKPVGDGTTISIASNGTISLANISDKAEGTYNAVLVNGVLTWVKPSETTVEGLSDLIQALTNRVDGHDDEIDALQEAVGVPADEENEVAASGLYKAVADEIARASAAETSLSNRIDNIDFVDPDELATALADYTKTEDLVEVSVDAEDKVLSMTDHVISSHLTLGYDGTNKAIKLYGKNDVELGSVDATPFIKDGMLENVEYDADTNTLTFTWNTAAGISQDTVVLSDIIEPYTAGNGLVLEGNEFAVVVDDESENFLSVGENGLKLSGVAQAISDAVDAHATSASNTYATKEELSAASNTYATKEELTATLADYATDTELATLEETVNGKFETLEGEIAETYATKEALNEVDGKATSNTNAINNLSGRLDGIVAQGGEPNVINNIKVNGVIQEIVDKTVDITVPTKFSELSDDSGFDARITAAQNAANQGISDAKAASDAAAQAQSEVDALETLVGGINTVVEGHTTSIANHLERIIVLENADSAHEAEYNALNNIVSGHTTAIASKADSSVVDGALANIQTNANDIATLKETTIPGLQNSLTSLIGEKANSADVYTKTEVGAIAEGKTLVQMIADAQTAATYNDAEVRGLIKANTDALAILNGDENTNGSVLKIAKAEAVAAANGAVANLIGAAPEALDTLEEIATWISNDETGTAALIDRVAANEEAIAAINDEETGIYAKALADAKAFTTSQINGLPAATAEKLGLVKVDNNTIVADENGVISVKKITLEMIEQGETELILNGGVA